MPGATAGVNVLFKKRTRVQWPLRALDLQRRGVPLRPEGRAAGIGEHVDRVAFDVDMVLHAGHGAARGVMVGVVRFGFPIQCAEQVVHQRKNDIEIAGLHQLATVMQFMQAAHLANPWQAGDRVARWQMLASMEHFVGQVAKDHTACEQARHVTIELFEQPPGGQRDHQAVQHNQPGGEQDHPPVARGVVGHVAGREKAVMIAGMAGIEQPRKGLLVMPQMPVDPVDREVEKQQRQRYRQPLKRLHLMDRTPEQADRRDPEHQDKTCVQPRVVEPVNIRPVTGTKRLRGLPHCGHLLSLLLIED
ncbi:hypothetical protein D3C78_1138970 [compost metagenome]